jgi:uncharacterized protein (UPF0335 family)
MKTPNAVAAAHLRAHVERLEVIDDQRKELAESAKEVLSDAKADGFDTKVIRELLRLRRMDPADRAEYDALLDLYTRTLELQP